MATPVVAVAGEAMAAATLNKYLAAGGGKVQVKAVWGRIQWSTATTFRIVSTTDSAELVDGSLTWATDHLNVALSGYTVTPIVLVSPILLDAVFLPRATGVSTAQAQIAWYNTSGTRQTTPNANFDCYVLVLGV